MDNNYDVIIVGAGISGIMAAYELAEKSNLNVSYTQTSIPLFKIPILNFLTARFTSLSGILIKYNCPL